MARQQYRICGELTWQSNSGNALLAIVNKNGSGKKLTLRSLEVVPVSTTTATTYAGAAATFLTLARATVDGGEEITPVPLDTNGTSWPSTARILKRATVSSPTSIGRIAVLKQLNQASLSWMGRFRPARWFGALAKSGAPVGDPEKITVRPGESVALYASTLNNSVPLRVTVTIVREIDSKAVVTACYFTGLRGADEAVFAFVNDAGSGKIYTILDIAIEEVGTFDSPYLQLVPVGGIIEAEACSPVSVIKMDTTYEDPSTYVDIRSDAPMLPYGVPENAFADSSAGSPKGFNYLKTKDFLGPTIRAFFPELNTIRSGAKPDVVTGPSHRQNDMLVVGAGLVLNEGEGIAVASAAETAAGATAAVGVSGWSCLDFAVTFDLEPAQIPTIAISGMVVGSRWRIERVSDNSEVASGVTVDGTASFVYDTEDTPLDLRLRVRKASGAPYYKPYEVTFNLTSAGVSIPVSQTLDT